MLSAQAIRHGSAAGSAAAPARPASTTDYQRIAQAIEFLDRGFRRQPRLAEVAEHVGLSEYHFHRLFQRWAGITPKRFLEFITAGHARKLLEDSINVLDASFDSGLSGPSRLHDLFVTLEGVTPGQVRDGGIGLELAWGVHPSPFGDCFLAQTDRGVTGLRFLSATDRDRAVDELESRWPAASLRHDPVATGRTIGRIVAGLRGEPTELRALVRGTNFQVRVWEALLRIPPGSAVSYQQVAAAVGRPTAVRAVGSAVAANPVPLLIPCHRVLRKTGGFGNYSGGAGRKKMVLAWEAAAVR